ncbi:MAG TPA: right-handed parallel beta-helix repeat-containing protein [Patescibacteria group bacterium]
MKSIVGYLLSTILFLHFATPVLAAEFFASPSGTAEGDGSIDRPWDITTAFTKTAEVSPGDTLWLRGGLYGEGGATRFAITLDGSLEQPITIRGYQDERATVNGEIYCGVDASYITFRNFELTNTEENRTLPNLQRAPGITLHCQGAKVINMLIYNTGHPAIGLWDAAGTSEIYGNLIWGTGTYDTTTNVANPIRRGAAIYTQNKHPEYSRLIKDNIIWRNFTFGIKVFGVVGGGDNYTIEGNTVFDHRDANIYYGSESDPVENAILEFNNTYHRPELGRENEWLSTLVGDATMDNVNTRIRNNYFVDGKSKHGALLVHTFQDVVVENNTLVSNNILARWVVPPSGVTHAVWDNNTYFSRNSNPRFIYNDLTNVLTPSQWRTQTGFDTNSSINAGPPTGMHIAVRPNTYDDGRGHVTVYNWEGATEAALDLNSVLEPNQEYVIKDAQHYFGPALATGIYTGEEVLVPLTRTEVHRLTGTMNHMQGIENTHTPSEFNVFVVQGGEVREPTPSPSPANQVTSPEMSPSGTPEASPSPTGEAEDNIDPSIDHQPVDPEPLPATEPTGPRATFESWLQRILDAFRRFFNR